MSKEFARKKLKWTKPGPGETPIDTPAAAVDPAAAADGQGAGGGPRSVPAPADGTQTNKDRAA